MKFHVAHIMHGITLPEYERLYFDEAFNTALCAHVKLTRALLELAIGDGVLRRVVRINADRDIPAAAAAVLGSAKLAYTEHVTYRLGSGEGSWETVSALLSDKVDCRGTCHFVPTDDGVRRIIDGNIAVKIFALGAVVERFIVADIERSYDEAARFTQQWINAGRHQTATT